MVGKTPSRRLLQPGALQCLQSSTHIPAVSPPLQSRRTIFGFLRSGKQGGGAQGGNAQGPTNPVLDEYLKRKPAVNRPEVVKGDLASSSIFDEDRKVQEREQVKEEQQAATVTVGGLVRHPGNMAAALDPDPRSRQRWQRKMVIREMQKGGRLSRVQFIQRTERESKSKSQNIKTSIKKLGPLARQIAGKTIDDAIAQMRFSKKKAAKDVLDYLEYARDEAIVKRGMGLGPVPNSAEPSSSQPAPVEIQLKDGKRHKVADETKIYVEQAWVGRGPFGRLPDYRARGRMFLLRPPWTSISVVLKEEATRVREWEEREEKRTRARLDRVWQPLPDRPIIGQRQWYSW